jgi:hypothetical protein
MDQFKVDTVVASIIAKFERRARMGKEKYGTDLDRTDLERVDWINHAQDELMDGILYLEKLKQELQKD